MNKINKLTELNLYPGSGHKSDFIFICNRI